MATKEVKKREGSGPKSDHSGRSCSSSNPQGVRRKAEGKELAPRSLRKQGKRFLSDCTEGDLKKLFD